MRSSDMEEHLAGFSGRPEDSGFGVQSINGSMKCSEDFPSRPLESSDNSTSSEARRVPPLLHRMSTIKPSDAASTRPPSLTFGDTQAPECAPSLPLTPLLIGSPAAPGSLSGSPKSTSTRSIRRSDEISIPDEASSHAIESSDDEIAADSIERHDFAPQLVMPSIRMPSRRPFTERGKSLGRLKVMIAGGSGRVQFYFISTCHKRLLTQDQ